MKRVVSFAYHGSDNEEYDSGEEEGTYAVLR